MQNKDQFIRLAKGFGLIALLLLGTRLFGALPCLLGYLSGRFIYNRLSTQHPTSALPLAAGFIVGAAVAVMASFGFAMLLGGVLQAN